MIKLPVSDIKIEYIDYRKLLPLQGNVRWLPTDNYNKLKKSFEEEGICLPFFIWRKGESDYLLDGHGREKVLTKENYVLIKDNKETYNVPCCVIEAENEIEARKKIFLINSEYQVWNKKEDEIDKFITDIDDDFLNSIVNIPDIVIPEIDIEDVLKDEVKEESIFCFNENPLFEHKVNKYDIPLLKPESCCAIPTPIDTFVGESNSNYSLFLQGHNTKGLDKTKSILCFYAWDEHFDGIWKKVSEYTENILSDDYVCVISPNYTITCEDPIAFQIWQIYRTRYIARYWQEAGIKVIPDVIWTDERSLEFAFLGIPKNVSCVSLQMQNLINTKEMIQCWEQGLKEMLRVVEPQQILAYCPRNKRILLERNLPDNFPVVFVEPWMERQRKKIEKKIGVEL